jgi:hypothetical protein
LSLQHGEGSFGSCMFRERCLSFLVDLRLQYAISGEVCHPLEYGKLGEDAVPVAVTRGLQIQDGWGGVRCREKGGSPGQGQGEIAECEPTSRVEFLRVGPVGRKMRRRHEKSCAHEGARRHEEPHYRAGYEVSALGEGYRLKP